MKSKKLLPIRPVSQLCSASRTTAAIATQTARSKLSRLFLSSEISSPKSPEQAEQNEQNRQVLDIQAARQIDALNELRTDELRTAQFVHTRVEHRDRISDPTRPDGPKSGPDPT